jgi:hypothetical protein
MTHVMIDYFGKLVEEFGDLYTESNDKLESESSGGNRRTVSNAAAEKFNAPVGEGDDARTPDQFAQAIVDRIAKQVKLATNGSDDPQASLHYWNRLVAAWDASDVGKKVETFVTAEVGKLKAAGVKLTDEERNKAIDDRLMAYSRIEAAKNMLEINASDDNDPELAEGARELLTKIETLKITRPRKSSGPTGPRLVGKYDFVGDDGNTKASDFRKLADIHGVNQADVKASVGIQKLGPDDGADEEKVKAWFQNPPSRFEFTVTDDKGVVHSYRAVQSTTAKEEPEEGEEENSDNE